MDEFTEIAVNNAIETINAATSRGVSVRFLIGAGCSINCGIPTASQILRIVEEKFPLTFRKLPIEERTDYRKIIDLLPYNERKELILEITRDKKISWGYLALARLMEAGYISRVLNLNFDSQLNKACSFINFFPAIYDFAVAPSSKIDAIVDPSIIHMHGQSYGFRQLSNVEETNAHIRKLNPLMENALTKGPLFVVGYSGESDELFKLIERKFVGDEFLTWLGYDYSPKPHLQKLISKNHAEYYGSIDFDAFIVGLAIKLNCWPPRLVSEPIAVMSELLKGLTQFRPTQAQDQLNLQYATTQKLKVLGDEWASKYGKLPSFEQDYLNMRYENIVRRFRSIKDKRKVLKSKYHAAIISSAFAELSYKKWHGCLTRQTPKQKRMIELRRALDLIETASTIISNPHYDNRRMCIHLLQYYVSKKEKYLLDALSIYELNKNNRKIVQFQTNAIAIYIELFKRKNEPKIENQVKRIWKRIQKIDRKYSYNYICFLVQLGDHENAREEMKVALVSGSLPLDRLRNDSDLDPLRSYRWFKSLLKKYSD